MDPNPIDSPLVEETVLCKTCGNTFEGRFCNRCGERIIHPNERTIRHFLVGVFHVLTHAESKMLTNIRLMLVDPGRLTKNYIAGIRQPYGKPIPMFFVANLIYFLFPVFETFNTSFYSQTRLQEYSHMIRPIADQKLKEMNIGEEKLGELYNAKTSTYSKLMLIVFVPMFGLVFAVINFKRSRFFADHLMMGLEFMCFMLFFNTIILSFLLIGIVWTGEFLGFNWHALVQSERTVIVPVVAVLTAYFLIRAERTFYEQRWWLAVIKGIALIYCATFVIKLYRFILFHITMWAL